MTDIRVLFFFYTFFALIIDLICTYGSVNRERTTDFTKADH